MAQGLKVGWSGHMGTSFILLSNPTLQLIQTGKGEAIRIRSILRSLVPTEDLVGIISIPLKLARKQSPILDLLNQDLLGGQQSGFNKSSTFILMHIKT